MSTPGGDRSLNQFTPLRSIGEGVGNPLYEQEDDVTNVVGDSQAAGQPAPSAKPELVPLTDIPKRMSHVKMDPLEPTAAQLKPDAWMDWESDVLNSLEEQDILLPSDQMKAVRFLLGTEPKKFYRRLEQSKLLPPYLDEFFGELRSEYNVRPRTHWIMRKLFTLKLNNETVVEYARRVENLLGYSRALLTTPLEPLLQHEFFFNGLPKDFQTAYEQYDVELELSPTGRILDLTLNDVAKKLDSTSTVLKAFNHGQAKVYSVQESQQAKPAPEDRAGLVSVFR